MDGRGSQRNRDDRSPRTPARRAFGATLAAVLSAVAVFGLTPAAAPGTGGPSDPQPTTPTPQGAELPPEAQELPDARTETTRTWALPNGQEITRTYAGPVNYRRSGRFERINGDLVRSSAPGVAYRNEGNAFRADLPDTADRGVRVSGGDAWVQFGMAAASGRGVKVTDDTVRYEDALPGVDLEYQAVNTGVKETLTLDSPRATTSFEYRVSMSDGLRARSTDDGRIEFRRGSETLFRFKPPFMVDAAGRVAGGQATPAYALSRRGDELTVSLAVDRAWLSAPDRQFPVVVDPTTTYVNGWSVMKGTTQETFIRSDTPDTRYDALTYLRVGKESTSPDRRHNALLKFDVAGSVTAESIVLAADLGLYLQGRLNTSQAPLHVHELNRAWTTAATWNRSDGTATWTGGSVGSFISGNVVPTSGWTVWRDLKPLAEKWVTGVTPNHGVMIDECCATPLNRYDFVKSTGQADRIPYLQIRYEHRNGTLPGYTWWTSDRGVVAGEQPDMQAARNAPPVAVNLGTGNLMITEVDRQPDVSAPENMPLSRVFNSVWWGAWSHGRSWTSDVSGVDITLSAYPDGALGFRGPTSSVIRFPLRPDGTYGKAEQADATVRAAGGEYIVTFTETNEQFVFPGTGRVLSRYIDGTGRETTWNYTTDADNRAIEGTAVDPSGRWTKWFFEYSAGHRRTERIETEDGKVYGYGYNAQDSLTTYTAPDGKITRYEYVEPYANGGERWLTKITRPDGSEIRFTYTSFNASRAVAAYTTRAPGATVDGPTTRFAYTQLTPSTGKTAVTAPDGKVTEHFWNHNREITHTLSGTNPPTVTLAGSLTTTATLADDGTSTYPLTLSAPAGTKSLEVLVDDEREDFIEQTCTTCALTRTWTMDPQEFAPGARVVKVVATSFAGSTRTQTLRPIVAGSTASIAPSDQIDSDETVEIPAPTRAWQDLAPRSYNPAAMAAAKSTGASATIAQATGTPTRTVLWNNLEGLGLMSTSIPPDPTGAIGEGSYVQMVNNRIGLYNRSTMALISQRHLSSFTGLDDVYDPQVTWDPESRRYFYAAAATPDGDRQSNNTLVFGWSRTASPSGLLRDNWCTLRMRGATRLQDDYPKLAVSRNHIIIGSNVFDQGDPGTETDDAYAFSRLLVTAKPRNGETACPTQRQRRMARFNRLAAPAPRAWTPVPVINATAGSRGGYVIAAENDISGQTGAAGTRLFSWRVLGTRSKPYLRNRVARVTNVPQFSVPPDVPQNDSIPISTFDSRLYQAVGVRNADTGQYQIWTQHTIASAADGTPRRSVARWYQFAPPPGTGAGGTLQVGTVDSSQVEGGGTNTFVFNGAVSPDRTGRSAAIHYNVARADLAVQIHARSRRSTDPANTMLGSQIIVETSRLNETGGFVSLDQRGCGPRDGVCRWGDYAAATPDPSNDGVIWGTNMYVGTNADIPYERFDPPVTGVPLGRRYRTHNFALLPSP